MAAPRRRPVHAVAGRQPPPCILAPCGGGAAAAAAGARGPVVFQRLSFLSLPPPVVWCRCCPWLCVCGHSCGGMLCQEAGLGGGASSAAASAWNAAGPLPPPAPRRFKSLTPASLRAALCDTGAACLCARFVRARTPHPFFPPNPAHQWHRPCVGGCVVLCPGDATTSTSWHIAVAAAWAAHQRPALGVGVGALAVDYRRRCVISW